MNPKRELIEVWQEDIDEIPDEQWNHDFQDVTKQEVKNHVENMGMKYLYNDGNDFYPDDGVSGRYCPTPLSEHDVKWDPTTGRPRFKPLSWYVVEETSDNTGAERFRRAIVRLVEKIAVQ